MLPSFVEESVRDDINWLKYRSQPWTEVLRKWQTTSTYRVQLFYGDGDIDLFKLMLNPKVDNLVSCLANTKYSFSIASKCYKNDQLYSIEIRMLSSYYNVSRF